MDNGIYTAEQRLLDGKIAELDRLLSEIRAMTTATRAAANAFSQQRDLRALYGGLLAICWGQPDTVARYLWRQNETERGALRAP